MADEKDPTNAGGKDEKVVETPKGGDDNENPGEKKPRFSQEDQEYINGLIDEVFARGHKKGQTELTTQITELQNQLQAAQSEISELKKPKSKSPKDGGDDKENKELSQLRAQVEELTNNLNTVVSERDGFKSQIESERKSARSTHFESSFLESVEEAEISFFNPKQVLKDVRDELRHEEDGSITVMNLKTGQPRMNTEMKPISLKDFLGEYARKNPHMVRTDVDGGTGSTESRRHETKDSKKSVKQMSPEEFEAFHQKVRSGQAK